MKFGKELADRAYAPWRDFYVDYDGLKTSLKATVTSKVFSEKLDVEFKKVDDFSARTFKDLERRASAAATKSSEIESWRTSRFSDWAEHVPRLVMDVTHLNTEIARLLEFVFLNVVGLRKLVKKFSSSQGVEMGSASERLLDLERFSQSLEFDALAKKASKLLSASQELSRRARFESGPKRVSEYGTVSVNSPGDAETRPPSSSSSSSSGSNVEADDDESDDASVVRVDASRGLTLLLFVLMGTVTMVLLDNLSEVPYSHKTRRIGLLPLMCAYMGATLSYLSLDAKTSVRDTKTLIFTLLLAVASLLAFALPAHPNVLTSSASMFGWGVASGAWMGIDDVSSFQYGFNLLPTLTATKPDGTVIRPATPAVEESAYARRVCFFLGLLYGVVGSRVLGPYVSLYLVCVVLTFALMGVWLFLPPQHVPSFRRRKRDGNTMPWIAAHTFISSYVLFSAALYESATSVVLFAFVGLLATALATRTSIVVEGFKGHEQFTLFVSCGLLLLSAVWTGPVVAVLKAWSLVLAFAVSTIAVAVRDDLRLDPSVEFASMCGVFLINSVFSM